jgi:tetratricopeptide (TPR) repeat protein
VGRPRSGNRQGAFYADRALELDPNNADGHIALGVLCLLKERVQLAPGSADISNLAGFILALSVCPEEAIRLDGLGSGRWISGPELMLRVLGNAYPLSGQIEEAIAAFEAYNARSPGFGLADLVIAYHENGQSEKSKDAARRLLSARRDFTIAAWLKTQVRRDKARLDADVARFAPPGLLWAERSFSLQKMAHHVLGDERTLRDSRDWSPQIHETYPFTGGTASNRLATYRSRRRRHLCRCCDVRVDPARSCWLSA